MKVRILTDSVKHNGQYLNQYEVYDLSDAVATRLVELGDATDKDVEKKEANPEPQPAPKKTPKADHYVAEAPVDENKLTQEQKEEKAKIDAENKPVIPPAKEQDPEEVTVVVDGNASGQPQE